MSFFLSFSWRYQSNMTVTAQTSTTLHQIVIITHDYGALCGRQQMAQDDPTAPVVYYLPLPILHGQVGHGVGRRLL